MCSMPQIQAVRSTPIPKPEWGTEPKLRKSRYHFKSLGQPMLVDALEKQVRVGHTLRSANDLSITFWSKEINALADLGPARPWFHVEGLDCGRISVNKDGFSYRLVRRS